MARIKLLIPTAGEIAPGLAASPVGKSIEVDETVAEAWCDGVRAVRVDDADPSDPAYVTDLEARIAALTHERDVAVWLHAELAHTQEAPVPGPTETAVEAPAETSRPAPVETPTGPPAETRGSKPKAAKKSAPAKPEA